MINDFGSLTHTEGGVNTTDLLPTRNYEIGKWAENIVDGFKFDMYIVGVLDIDMFTKHQVIRVVAANGDPNPN